MSTRDKQCRYFKKYKDHDWKVSDIPDYGEPRVRYTCGSCGIETMVDVSEIDY